MSERDGGPAFPQPDRATEWDAHGNVVRPDPGMKLRDYFAAAALSGLVQRRLEKPGDMQVVVQSAYAYADLMLAMRAVVPLRERAK